MSPASSGGVSSNTLFTASTMIRTGSDSASRTSSEWRLSALGTPETMSRPLISVDSEKPGKAFPIATLICSAVGSPINRLYFRFTYWRIASSILSPATRTDWLLTIPPREMTATSVVPPPMSTIMLPDGSVIGRPAPMAAASGSSMRYTSRAPALCAGSRAGGRPPPGRPAGGRGGVGDADDDAGPHEGARLVRLPDKVPEHRLGDLEIGDDAVLDGADRHDVPRRAADHPLRLDSDGEHLLGPPGVPVDRHGGGLGADDPLHLHVHQGRRGTEVDRQIM